MHIFVLDNELAVNFTVVSIFYIIIHSYIILELFLEKPFYQEALELTRGYKPIAEKLVEPIEPLQIDTTSKFNVLAVLGARVSLVFENIYIAFFFFQLTNKHT